MGKSTRGVYHKRRTTPKITDAVTRLVSVIEKKSGTAPEKTAAQKMPAPPANLNAIAKEHWHFMIKELGDQLIPLDAVALALYCETFAEWQKAGQELKKSGGGEILKSKEGNKYRNPWLDVRKSARKEMGTYLALFGMSPHDRMKLGRENPNTKPGEPNEFSEF